MLGLALQGSNRHLRGRPERLIQKYMEAAILQPEIRAIAIRVVKGMITDVNTKKPITVQELVEETNLDVPDIIACLVLLARKGRVHRLNAASYGRLPTISSRASSLSFWIECYQAYGRKLSSRSGQSSLR